ncbi:hypothetical protein BDA96_05G124800 [Sorghum bicolor]|uniref:Uncharacterized protein n=1 Tax=Sorghum bicolor TaxID=4558 RepID=A0A921UGK0_SORBI|nr:hypothetical protein BDA96_05G124800 [Sorghum bicolor]
MAREGGQRWHHISVVALTLAIGAEVGMILTCDFGQRWPPWTN